MTKEIMRNTTEPMENEEISLKDTVEFILRNKMKIMVLPLMGLLLAAAYLIQLPDRYEALHYALSVAKPGDTVIATGKGHEKSLCRGKQEYPWSDQEEIKKILKKLQ